LTESSSLTLGFNFPTPLIPQGNDPLSTWRRYGVKVNRLVPGGGTETIYDNTNGRAGQPGFGNGEITITDNSLSNLSIASYEVRVFEMSGGVSGKLNENGSCKQYFCIGTSSNPGDVGATCEGLTPDQTSETKPF